VPLQIDATLYYAQPADTPFDVLKATDSPYNTYMHGGLPPTPIASPSRASIRAAMNPAPNPEECSPPPEDDFAPADQCLWLYYVLSDAEGHHAFATNLAEHEVNVQTARDAGLLG
jgi:peptidoglycan lytic transglycosylase G